MSSRPHRFRVSIFGATALLVLASTGIWVHTHCETRFSATGIAPGRSAPLSVAQGNALLRQRPLTFVENMGQWDTPARYVARGHGIVLFAEPAALAVELHGKARGGLVRLHFEGSAEDASIEGESPLPGRHHFFLGDDPARWHSHVRGYRAVRYRSVWRGVDVRLREGEQGRFEYDLLLAPGEQLQGIAIRCQGIDGMRMGEDGSLVLGTPAGLLRQSAPIAWQVTAGGALQEVRCRYRLLGDDRFGFTVEDLDPTLALVVDPGLLWSTYLGSAGDEVGDLVALDASGEVTIAGRTSSSSFPTTAGAFDTTYNGGTGSGGLTFRKSNSAMA